jgi:ATP-dependent helicase/DNAse subunit B
MDKKKKVLSASRIKTLEDCSWKYWCNYHEKIPQTQNDGACRGTVCHTIFELLLNKKHKKHFERIMERGFTAASKPVARLIKTLLLKSGCHSEENHEMCLDMVYVGLNSDFFGKGGAVDKPEIRFTIKNKNPEYEIMGFIDKKIKYKDKIKIVDYKSSKRKFPAKDLESNIQAMAYTLAAKRKWPKSSKNVEVEFLFLKFPRQPSQQITIPQEQLDGFEHYLAHMYKIINSFTEGQAKTNYAKDKMETKFFCKAGKHWKCPYLEPFDYYSLESEDGEILKGSFTKSELGSPKDGQKIIKKKYEGCPAHPYEEVSTTEDPFDWA